MIQNNFVEHSSRGFTSLKLSKTFHLKVLIFYYNTNQALPSLT